MLLLKGIASVTVRVQAHVQALGAQPRICLSIGQHNDCQIHSPLVTQTIMFLPKTNLGRDALFAWASIVDTLRRMHLFSH